MTDPLRDLTVGDLLMKQARIQADAPAVEDNETALTYRVLEERATELAGAFLSTGIRRGDRIAVLSENRREYLEIEMACAKAGVIAACLNWRMSDQHLGHCVRLVDPRLLFVSTRYAAHGAALAKDAAEVVELGDHYEGFLKGGSGSGPVAAAEPEDGLLILYTERHHGPP